MLATVAALALALWVPADDPPASKEPPTKEVLAAITERGRLLAGYDEACWHSSDAVMEKRPKEGSFSQYIARKTDKGWVVAFGNLDLKTDKFQVVYEATQGKDPKDFAVKEFNPPKAEDGFLKNAAKSINTALKDFRGEQRPYNVAVLPAEKSQFWVYIVPAPTKSGVWPLGGDVRYQVSADGAKIVEKRQMHKGILELPAPEAKDDNVLVAGVHTHVLSDIPEDSDVFFVLTRKPATPEIVTSKLFMFTIGVDGKIEYSDRPGDSKKKK